MKYPLIIIFLIVFACNTIKDCDLDENREYALVTFFNISDSTERDTLRFNSVISDQSPYEFYNFQDTILGTMRLFLDPNLDSVVYQFETDSFDYDLTLKYDNETTLYSVECGPSIKYENMEFDSFTFDSISVTNPNIDNELLINAEIYF